MVTGSVLFQKIQRFCPFFLPFSVFLFQMFSFFFQFPADRFGLLILFFIFLFQSLKFFLLAFLLQKALAQLGFSDIHLLLHGIVTLLSGFGGGPVIQKLNNFTFSIFNLSAAAGNFFLDFLISGHNLAFLLFHGFYLIIQLEPFFFTGCFLLHLFKAFLLHSLLPGFKMLFTLYCSTNLLF